MATDAHLVTDTQPGDGGGQDPAAVNAAGVSSPATAGEAAATPEGNAPLPDADPVAAPVEIPAVNEVRLIGRVVELAEERELAGGVRVVRWTLRIPRGPGKGGSDLIDCVTLDADLQSRARRWPAGRALTVEGALRRRFFRSGGRTASRMEVEAQKVTEFVGDGAGDDASKPTELTEPTEVSEAIGDHPSTKRRRGLLRRVGG